MKPEPRFLTALALVIWPLLATASEPGSPLSSADESSPPPLTFTIPAYSPSVQERETVAACLVLEAASQGEFGMRGVMSVVRNRARGLPELFAFTVLREKQFSAFNRVTAGRESLGHAIARAKADRMWSTARAIVEEALLPDWNDPTDGATHYTRASERTRWTRSLAQTTTIGAHAFYR